mgnify:CR=1 FL=1
MAKRPFYRDRIRAYLDKPLVKVITGMRRVGKSTLLAQVRDELLARGVPSAQLLSINKGLVAWDGVRTYLDLDQVILRVSGLPPGCWKPRGPGRRLSAVPGRHASSAGTAHAPPLVP